MSTKPKKKENLAPIIIGIIFLIVFLGFVVYIASRAVSN